VTDRGGGMLRVSGVSKRFGSVQALSDVDLEFEPGKIHAVLGENGAGKSTLLKVLGGFLLPDAGAVSRGDSPLPLGDPVRMRRSGVELIHQHFALVPAFTVAENLALSQAGTTGLRLMSPALVEPGLMWARQLGWDVDPATRVEDLAVGIRQRVEILKALATDAPILMLDEPTAVLSPPEVADLFQVLRRLRDEGKTIILIAHKLSEVLAVADRTAVLRAGRKVLDLPASEVDPVRLAEAMVGEVPAISGRAHVAAGEVVLRTRVLSVRDDRGVLAVRGLDLDVRAGEILGIGGVDGNGQVELAEALCGTRQTHSGELSVAGAPPDRTRVGYIPPDRQSDGLALEMSVEENLLIDGMYRTELRQGPFWRVGRVRAWSRRLIERFGIKVDHPTVRAGALSGGNQQKIVVARTLDAAPATLVAVNPTRGLDLKAAHFVREQILAARDRGCAVVVVSSDLEELVELADRVEVMSSGTLRPFEAAASVVGGPE
jgi:general nucleoside transport system ATP-binding protein